MNPDRHYLAVLFDHYPTGVLIADDHARYVDANRMGCALLCRSREQIVGAHLSDLVAPGREAEVNVQWQSFIRDGSQQGVFEVTLSDGTSRRLQFNARANFSPGLHCAFLSPLSAAPSGAGAKDDAVVVCAWTKRVHYEGEWMLLEEYLLVRHGQFVTHGMSPEAFRRTSNDQQP